jgi:cytochrome c553
MYAYPFLKVNGPHGWPSYVAKASLGIVPVEDDGSAHFLAPAGKVLYFQALDENLNEVQRMRSVVQLQSGETRACIGCHENRSSAPPTTMAKALLRPAQRLQPPPWSAVPFSYEEVVQPVWNAHCVRCHDGSARSKIDLTATLDQTKAPASYRTLIQGGWVHYFNLLHQLRHHKAEPLSFGSVKSKLFGVLADKNHAEVRLTRDEMHRVKCWIDLNCPLWPDYVELDKRPVSAQTVKK